MCGTKCCCKGGQHYHRRYLTKAEQTERLQKYADDLEKELQAVNEKLKTLQ